jgi:hypothetical protein
MKSKRKTPQPPEYPKVFETFQDIGAWQIYHLTRAEPWCFNSGVGIRKYRVTVEEIPEPVEVLAGRLRALRATCKNHHDWGCLQSEATRLGVTLE